MKLHFFGDVSSVFDGLDAIKNRLLIELCSDGEQVQVISGNGFLEISGTHGIYSIKYQKKAECFRGLSILIDRIKKGNMILYKRNFPDLTPVGRWWMFPEMEFLHFRQQKISLSVSR